MNNPDPLHQLSKEDLATSLQRLKHGADPELAERDALQELQVHRVELEIQNRALTEAQNELQASLTRYATLYDGLPIGYVTVTPQGRILEANKRAVTWLRTDLRTLVGRHLRGFLTAEEAMRVSVFLDQCAQSDQECVLDSVLTPPDGARRCVQLTGQRAKAGDGTWHIHLAMTDIDALKQSERSLAGLNAELDALSHAISHDLRAPLVSISTYGRIVLDDHGAQLDPDGREMIDRMQRISVRLEETLRQLLDYSRLTRGTISAQTVDLEEIVRDLLIEQRALIQYRKAEVDVQRPLASVLASRAVMEQVLRNLLSNALKYTVPGEPPRIRISTAVHNGTVVLQVADRGIGIDPRHHGRLFKLFERLQPHSQYPGAGVGLAIVRRAVERMSGRVWLKSEPGQGSSFFVELPAA